MSSLQDKEFVLRSVVRSYEKLAIAFSGGVDSTLLLYVAYEELNNNVVALTSYVPMTSESEIIEAQEMCRNLGIQQILCEPDVLSIDEVRMNDPKRCYFCKAALFGAMKQEANKQGFTYIADGTNVDDLADYRPGMKAIQELEIVSPFLEAGFTKDDIRSLSKEIGLSTWDKQSNACLATRFPYGKELSSDLLRKIDEAENAIHALGFNQVRVRVHDDVVRLELNVSDFSLLLDGNLRNEVLSILQTCGFTYVTLDLEGFRSGSMNASIKGHK